MRHRYMTFLSGNGVEINTEGHERNTNTCFDTARTILTTTTQPNEKHSKCQCNQHVNQQVTVRGSRFFEGNKGEQIQIKDTNISIIKKRVVNIKIKILKCYKGTYCVFLLNTSIVLLLTIHCHYI